MKIARVLLSEQALPSSSMGSWTQRMAYFFESSHNIFDFVISTRSALKSNSKVEFKYANTLNSRFQRKFFPKQKFKHFIKELDVIVASHDKVIVCVMDNVKLKNEVSNFIDKNELHNKIRVVFYNCGYSYFLTQNQHQEFSKNLDEIIFLTSQAYQFNKEQYLSFIPEVTVLHNPIDKTQFYQISKTEKQNLLQKHSLENKKIYLWLSHDRPKKGLSIVLNAWNEWAVDKKDVHLLVIGTNYTKETNNITFLGKIPSNAVHEYYKLAHVYLFPTLWQEGFGLSLAQAICTGCYCITSDNGGVVEFIQEQNGATITKPNIVSEWIFALEKSYQEINNGWENTSAGNQIITIEEWAKQFASIFVKWEQRMKL